MALTKSSLCLVVGIGLAVALASPSVVADGPGHSYSGGHERYSAGWWDWQKQKKLERQRASERRAKDDRDQTEMQRAETGKEPRSGD